ncbi:MAG TPA: LLM class F420-dependent oxidoreductase [Anaerolineales bacterium]|nr:LLM class F420-dependent oxidoreductase [Anaerolineales bacterium]
MKLGLQIVRFDWTGSPANIGPTLRDIGQAAEAAGLDSLWVMDHFFQIRGIGPVADPMLEAYATLGYLASATARIHLGTMVTGVVYRYPGILIKTATTLDILSGGRAYFGVGAAWFEREARGLGVPFPSTKSRFELLEDTLRAAHQMWAGATQPFQGKHVHMKEPLAQPAPLTRPHPPILVGGGGERKTLRLVAQYADACNLFTGDLANMRHKLDVLRRHCDDVGRPYDEIERTALATIAFDRSKASASRMIEDCRRWAQAGIQHLIFSMANVHEVGLLESLGREVVPVVAEF